jgi:phosphopantetheine adenylyltransferase
VREIAEHGGRIEHLVAPVVAEALARRYALIPPDEEMS